MKKTLLSLSLATLTLGVVNTAQASLYYGLGYAQIIDGGEVERLFERTVDMPVAIFEADGIYDSHEKNYDSGAGVTATIGFPIKNNFSIETRYSYLPDAVDGSWKIKTTTGFDADYKFNADAHKFGVHGVYRHSLNSFLYAKGGVGVTHTMYDAEGTVRFLGDGQLLAEGKDQTPKGFKEEYTSVEASLGFGVRLTSCCNVELEYNTSEHNENVLASLMWRF